MMNMAASGLVAVDAVSRVNAVSFGTQEGHRVAPLVDGGYAVVWVNHDGQGEGLLPDGGNAASEIRLRLFNDQGQPQGPEASVNTATRGFQVDPQLAVLANGSIAVTWTDGWDFFGGYEHPGSLGSAGARGDTSSKAVKLQLFTAAGARLGAELLVNTTTTNYQQASAITALTDGGFIVGWEDGSTTMDSMGAGGGASIKARFYGSTGAPAGSEKAWSGDWCYSPLPVGLAQGGFANVYLAGYYYDPASVVVRLHDAGGNAQGGQVTLPLGGQGAGAQWTAAALADGGLVVAWTHRDAATGDGDGKAVLARLVNANGSTRGSTLVLNSVTAADQEDVRVVGLDGGGFVAVWESTTAPDASGNWTRQLRSQAFDANGSRRGAEQVVEGNDPSLQLGDVVALGGGGYAVGWHGRSWIDASARAYGADLQPLGDALVLHDSGGFQSQVDLTALADGRFAATWAASSDGYTGGDGNGAGLETRVFATRGVDSVGSANADTLRGTPLDDRIDGGAGNDLLVGAGGNDTVIGGAGTDTLWLATPAADVLAHLADVQWVPGVLSRVGSGQGTVTLDGVERLRLDDGLFAFDTQAPGAGSMGGEVWQAAALYRAASGAMPGLADLSHWTWQADQQATMADLAQAMLAEYVPAGLPTSTLVAHLYQVLAGSPAPADLVAQVSSQVGPGRVWASQGDLFAWAASLSLNVDAMVDLTGQPFAGSIQALDPAAWLG
jgi:hypothetical protein